MKSISYTDFSRKRFLKLLRNRFDHYIIFCKLIKTKNDKLARLNFERILNIISLTVQNKKTFETNNIYYVLNIIENYCNFLIEFSKSVENNNSIDSLKDIQIEFFKRQSEIEKTLKENLEKPTIIEFTNTDEPKDVSKNEQ